MIELYVGPTPNGQKVAILLEELGLEYRCHEIDILRGDQLTPEFLAINPNNKQPAIIDTDGPGGTPITLWESCAILVYLAEKQGRFIPEGAAERAHMMKWLFFQASTQGPMSGQYAHFAFYAAPEHQYPYAIDRYLNEMNRQLGVMDRYLENHTYFLDDYSIADMALLPYGITALRRSRAERPNMQAWVDRLCERDAVQKGLAIMQNKIRKETIAGGLKGYGAEHRDILFGDQQFAER
ncbi:MAG: glutathione S-transferase N-terminal domain-containing protein [Alphaproteobacteria bacterium]